MEKKFLHLWNLKGKTDPTFTKQVDRGGYSFTAIDAYYKIMQATEVFGPYGHGWGLEIDPEKIMLIPATKTTRKGTFDGQLMIIFCDFWANVPPSVSREIWGVDETHVIRFPVMNDIWIEGDRDIAKKIFTDTITKALSYLGFSNDVFLGKMDGNRYIPEKDVKAGDELIEALKNLSEEFISTYGDKARSAVDQMMKVHQAQGFTVTSVEKDMEKIKGWLEKKRRYDSLLQTVAQGGVCVEKRETEETEVSKQPSADDPQA